MWNGAISLSKGMRENKDSEGFTQYEIEYGGQIPANILDSTRTDETLASQMGYTADITVEIMRIAYNGEGFFRNEETGKEYSIKRTFHPDKKNVIRIVGEEREHGKI